MIQTIPENEKQEILSAISSLPNGNIKELNLEEKKKIKTKIETIKENIKNPPPETNHKIINSIIRYYIISFFVLISIMVFETFLWFTKIKFTWKMLSLFFTLPIVLTFLIFMLIRYFVFDKERIKGYIIVKTSKNFLKAIFFLPQKRVVQRIVQLEDDGVSYKIDKHTYMVESDAIYLDENNFPVSYYIPNIPNPCKFNFSQSILDFYEGKGEGINGNILYSSENLTKYKGDKLVDAIHKDNSDQVNKMLVYFMIMGGAFLVVIIIIVFLLTNKSQGVQSIINNTGI